MTSGNFTSFPISSIIVDRENRQRKQLEKIEELAESIRQTGLINPVVITREGVLVAGERRLEAHKLLGYDHIHVHFTDEIDKKQLHLIELEENVKRVDLSWQDHVDAVAAYHELQKTIHEEWNNVDTAEALGMSDKHVGRFLLVDKMVKEGVKEVVEAPKFSVAVNFAERKQDRSKTSFLMDLAGKTPPPGKTEPSSQGNIVEGNIGGIVRRAELLNCDFLSWSSTIQTSPFNLIHCDFPYGVSAGDKTGLSSAKTHGGYEDGAEIYFNLLSTFTTRQDNFISPSAHMLFWFSMNYYTETVGILREAGWRVDIHPFIWHKSDNVGIIPDANRGPRRIYETALFCTRGDRKVVKPVGNSFSGPTTKEFHMSEKSFDMLSHFFRMLIDDSTVMLDPTCGSGMAVKAAEAAGAHYSLGLELDPFFYEGARQNLKLEA